MLPQSEPDQVCVRLETKLFHDPVFMKGNRPDRYIQHGCRFFHRAAFSQKLQYLPLALRKIFGAAGPGVADELVD